MEILSILKRDGGTKVDIEGTKYHFKPNEAGDHVATVTIKEHQKRFLAIPEGYEVYQPGSTPKTASATEVLLGSNQHDSTYEIGGKTWQLGDLVERAFKASGLTTDEWNLQPEDARAEAIDTELDKIDAEAGDDGKGGEGDEKTEADEAKAEAAKAYKEKFGRAPHHRWSLEKIQEELANATK